MTRKIVRALGGRGQTAAQAAPGASGVGGGGEGGASGSSSGKRSKSARQTDAAALVGIAVSAGSAIAPALIYHNAENATLALTTPAVPLDPSAVAAERTRLYAALEQASADLRAHAQTIIQEVGQPQADIFEFQAMLLEDVTLRDRLDELLTTSHYNAVDALRVAAEEQALKLEALDDPLWQARASDMRDVAWRALRILDPAAFPPSLAELLAPLTAPVILIAHDLAPSDTAQLRREQIVGVALASGSETSHAAILLKALQIPTLVGLGPRLLAEARDGAEVALDTATATLLLAPTEAQKRTARAAATQWSQQLSANLRTVVRWRERPGSLRDGTLIPLLANVGSRADAQLAAEYGAEGIGLMRTEFVFAEAQTPPTAEEQAATYLDIISALGRVSGPIIIRTLDAGNDKPLRSLRPPAGETTPTEANPALGVRGIRLQLARRELLEAQLRGLALTRARTEANLHVMLPMVTTLEETIEVQRTLATQRAAVSQNDAAARPLPIGIMVETPAAALMASAFAATIEFFSVGTNDLTQYVMAGDRLNSALSALIQPLQPAVLRAISMLVTAARPAGRHVGVCGEMAGDPRMALLLVGLGVNDLSMNPVSIPAVKATLAAHTLEETQAIAARALAAVTLAEVEAAVAAIQVVEP